ncbi:hypothetical protein Ancab_004840 [Ancistrocladus abbreviatus]
MESSGNRNSCVNDMMMGYGTTSSGGGGGGGICPMDMMTNSNTNALYLPLPHHTNQDHQNFTSGCSIGVGGSSALMMEAQHRTHHYHPQHHHNDGGGSSGSSSASSSLKAKIMSHPHYSRLLAAYVNCQKVGAPPEVVAKLEEACAAEGTAAIGRTGTGYLGEDPALDQFMEAYCEMLTKYEQELTKPFKEAMIFLSRIEFQFKALTLSSSSSAVAASACGDTPVDRNGSSEEEIDVNTSFIDPHAEDRELKCQLLHRYGGYLGSLKQEFMKKRKKGKLPKEARQQLLNWWSKHYKWPYPSEAQKLALAESTGLDQKQINNWFINQRKRHWKPSEDMQFMVMDATHQHYYLDNALGTTFPMDVSATML